jgi:hypothetical protein
MEDNEIAAKRHKKRKTDCFYAPFASFRVILFSLCVAYVAAFSVMRVSCSYPILFYRPAGLKASAIICNAVYDILINCPLYDPFTTARRTALRS